MCNKCLKLKNEKLKHMWSTIERDLHSWQFFPEYPAGQRHTYALTASAQVPPLWHGLFKQLSTSASHHTPRKVYFFHLYVFVANFLRYISAKY